MSEPVDCDPPGPCPDWSQCEPILDVSGVPDVDRRQPFIPFLGLNAETVDRDLRELQEVEVSDTVKSHREQHDFGRGDC